MLYRFFIIYLIYFYLVIPILDNLIKITYFINTFIYIWTLMVLNQKKNIIRY